MKSASISEVGQGSAGLIRSAPISLLSRSSLGHWQALGKLGAQAQNLAANAQLLRETLQQRGASFFDDLLQQTGLLKSQLEQAMAELAGLGLLTADSFMGLRALLKPANSPSRRHARRTRASFMPSALQQAGRWSLVSPTTAGESTASEEQLEYCARLLLGRYAVLMRPLLERESHMPAWRDLLPILRRMEARGEIRGGRFVDGVAGEQFALPEAVPGLRAMRQRADDQHLIMISATDPLNLLGILHPGERLPALHTNRLLICNGEFVAVKQATEVRYLRDMPNNSQWRLRDMLIRDRVVEASDAAIPQEASLLRG
jgi:ATP-dependent Lhr-like helicase